MATVYPPFTLKFTEDECRILLYILNQKYNSCSYVLGTEYEGENENLQIRVKNYYRMIQKISRVLDGKEQDDDGINKDFKKEGLNVKAKETNT